MLVNNRNYETEEDIGASAADEIEFAENPDQRCPAVLLCDTSRSMAGDRINQLNSNLYTFKQAVSEDDTAAERVEVAVVTFADKVTLEHEFALMRNFNPPKMKAGGGTNLAGGIHFALDLVEKRKRNYRDNGIPYYRPWLIILTDGMSGNTPTEMDEAGQAIAHAERRSALTCFPIGVGTEGRDALERSLKGPGLPPKELDPNKWREFFQWLSASVSTVSNSRSGDIVPLPASDDWSATTI